MTITVDPQPRTPWEMAVMAFTRRATTAYPKETPRILKGMAIVLEGGVTMEGEKCRVQSQRHADVQYQVNGVCTCYDAAHAPEGRCKHRWAKSLYVKATHEMATEEGLHTYWATYYPDDQRLSSVQGTARECAKGWVFTPEDSACGVPVASARLVLGGRIDLCDAQRAKDGESLGVKFGQPQYPQM